MELTLDEPLDVRRESAAPATERARCVITDDDIPF
jgi:hypothetical protein